MADFQNSDSFIREKFENIYKEADHKVWQVAYISAIFVVVESLLYNHLFIALLGIAINFFVLWMVSRLFSQRLYKNTLMGLAMLLWPILMIILSNQLHEIRFIAFGFITILAIYQDPRPVISLSLLAALLVVTYSLPIIWNLESQKFFSAYLVRPEDVNTEKMLATLLVLSVITAASFMVAILLRKKSLSDALYEYGTIKQQKVFEKNLQFAKHISEGELSITLSEDKDDQDELSLALEEMRKNLLAAEVKEKEDRFISTGLAEAGDILRKNNESTKQLTDAVLTYLVKYLKVNQGGLFLLEGEGEDQYLKLYACYAFDRKKYLEKEVGIGQGLLGQVVLEKERIFITDLPSDYVNITSGLGQANPNCILLIPLMVNEEVVGALELASFEKMEEYQIAFTEKVAVSIASSIASARVNSRTQFLLREAQEQAEQLRSQEEEMRQNMEELAATQEEMHRSSLEMESRMQAIEASGIGAIEFDLDGKILYANQALLDIIDYTLPEVEGKPHHMFVKPEEAASAAYRQMWTNLASGKKLEGEFEMVSKSGEIVYLKGAYVCLLDVNHEPQKIIKLAFDVTENKMLISEAQEQTKQIMAQEKELRQHLLTLKELQQESDMRMQEMNYYLEALNTSMITLEMDGSGRILGGNAALTEKLKFDEEKLKTLCLSDLHFEDDLMHPEYQTLWQRLAGGENYQTILRRKTSEGEARWFRAYYFPQKNEQDVMRIIELSTDITMEKLQEEKILQNEKILHERVKSIEDKAYERIVKLKKDMKEKLAEKDQLIAELEGKANKE
ncbi:MAG: PAS domain-containing protein [Cyclobacteriaceae bacterium]